MYCTLLYCRADVHSRPGDNLGSRTQDSSRAVFSTTIRSSHQLTALILLYTAAAGPLCWKPHNMVIVLPNILLTTAVCVCMMYIIMQLLTLERCVFKVLPDVTARHCSSSALEKLKPRRGAGHSFHKPGPGRPALGSAEHAALIHHTGRNHPHFMAHQKLKHLENPFITNRYRSA